MRCAAPGTQKGRNKYGIKHGTQVMPGSVLLEGTAVGGGGLIFTLCQSIEQPGVNGSEAAGSLFHCLLNLKQ